MRIYEHPADGLLDAMRLAKGMTHKWAALELPFGGAKAVLAVDHTLAGDERRGLLERYGALVESLNGLFSTGEDLGTTPEDFAVIAGPSQPTSSPTFHTGRPMPCPSQSSTTRTDAAWLSSTTACGTNKTHPT